MDLTPHVETLRRELAAAADVGGPEMRAAAESLTSALESSVRLTLLEVLSDAAESVTSQIEPGLVELRIRGREPELVVTPPAAGSPGAGHSGDEAGHFGAAFGPSGPFGPGAFGGGPPGWGPPGHGLGAAWGPPAPPSPPPAPEASMPQGDGDHGTARMTLRLPEPLKARIEQVAGQAGMSVNAWLVRALAQAVSDHPRGRPGSGPGQHITGWAR